VNTVVMVRQLLTLAIGLRPPLQIILV
jgi:hypothetical protein